MTANGPNRYGRRWAQDCARRARQHGFKARAHDAWTGRGGRGDLEGIPETIVECKNITGEKLGESLGQALADQATRGELWAVLFKKQRTKPVGQGFAVQTIDQYLTKETLIACLRGMVGEARWSQALDVAMDIGGNGTEDK